MRETSHGLLEASRDYQRIADAIRYLDENFRQQPDLDRVAAAVGLSPHHFHRLFSRWVGTTPKRFLQFVTADYARQRLRETANVLDAAWDAGLSGGGRLHDLMVTVEAVTPGEYKSLGQNLMIRFDIHPTPFGDALLAATDRGLCSLEFVDRRSLHDLRAGLQRRWPEAALVQSPDPTRSFLGRLFPAPGREPTGPFTLHIKGTNFQLQVWQALLRIPAGSLTTYGDLARSLDRPRAARAVGQAVGWNPVSYVIPCHRVISSTVGFGGYRWGLARKRAILGWEALAAGA